jgi:hypothetical protein
VILEAEDGKQKDSRDESDERVTTGVHGDRPCRFLPGLFPHQPCAAEKLDSRYERYDQIHELLITVAFHCISSPEEYSRKQKAGSDLPFIRVLRAGTLQGILKTPILIVKGNHKNAKIPLKITVFR